MSLTTTTHPYTDSARLFNQVAGQPWAIYLDSGNTRGTPPRVSTERFDILLMEPVATIVTVDGTTTITGSKAKRIASDDPLEIVRTTLVDELPQWDEKADQYSYLPGAYGYFSYDLARQFEDLPEMAVDDEHLPQMAVGIFDTVVVVDHALRCTHVISTAQSSELPKRWIGLIAKSASQAPSTRSGARPLLAKELLENQTREEYQEKFNRVRSYTIDGDCYQVNLAKRFATKVSGCAWATYQNLRQASPAPYGAYMHFPFAEVLSNSPESFIRCRNRQVTTSPIKGTRPRDHGDPDRDQKIAEELASSTKDRAENLMIVDLMRNDLSRCCELGSVKVPSLFRLHSFANVHHLISTVTGVLNKGLHALDLLRSCFPGGSITGAPKIRAMEIIEELEPHRRGLYCGSIAYIGMDGSLETSIAIRTIVVKNGIARYSAGGGLVIDSVEEDEYQELLYKASMMNAALLNQGKMGQEA